MRNMLKEILTTKPQVQKYSNNVNGAEQISMNHVAWTYGITTIYTILRNHFKRSEWDTR